MPKVGTSYSDINGVEKIIDVVLAFVSETRYERLLGILLDKMMELTNSDAGTLYIVEDGKLHFRIIRNVSLNIYQPVEPGSDSSSKVSLPPILLDKTTIDNVSAYAAINNEVVIVDDVYEDQRFNFAGPKNYDAMTGYRTGSMLALPLAVSWEGRDNNVLGVIQLINATDPETGQVVPYGDIHNPPIIPALSRIASNTLGNLAHMREVRTLFRSFVAVLTQAIDERSSYNNFHTQRVAWYSGEFAKYMSKLFEPGHPFYFNEERTERLIITALLHDIGKIITPLEIMDKRDRLGQRLTDLNYRFIIKRYQLEIDMLQGLIDQAKFTSEMMVMDSAMDLIDAVNIHGAKDELQFSQVQALANLTYRSERGKIIPMLDDIDIEMLSIRKGTLSENERSVMQKHAELTGKLLEQISFWKYYQDIPEWTRNHHEFMDGSGYPRGLTGDSLSIETNIITMIDIFEALTAFDRPYKRAVPIDQTLKIVEDMAANGKLNKDLVSLFVASKIWLTELD